MGTSEVMIIILIMIHLTVGQPSTPNSHGPVLILGDVDSVELFNVDTDTPSDSTCTAVPDLPSNFPSTTIINNNQLLLCGGTSCWTWTASETGWKEAPNLSNLTYFTYFYGQLVSVDGSAFLLGGTTESGVSNKIYTTTGETWQLAGQLQQGSLAFHCLVVVGKNIITTGGYAAGGTLATVEMFNTEDGTTTQLSDMIGPRHGHACTTYNTGDGDEIEIIVAGDFYYDPFMEKMSGTMTGDQGVWQFSGWTRIGRLPIRDDRSRFPMVNINNNLYILGGLLNPEERVATSSVLVSTNGGRNWTEADTALQTPRYGHTAILAGGIC